MGGKLRTNCDILVTNKLMDFCATQTFNMESNKSNAFVVIVKTRPMERSISRNFTKREIYCTLNIVGSHKCGEFFPASLVLFLFSDQFLTSADQEIRKDPR